MLRALLLALTLTSTFSTSVFVDAHAGGSHDQQPIQSQPQQGEDWASKHMAEEHHLSTYDPGSFFTLHDYDSSGKWTADDIRRTYGLKDESAKGISEEKKVEVVRRVLELFDEDGDGRVARVEWLKGVGRGVRLPDFGVGFVGLLSVQRTAAAC